MSDETEADSSKSSVQQCIEERDPAVRVFNEVMRTHDESRRIANPQSVELMISMGSTVGMMNRVLDASLRKHHLNDMAIRTLWMLLTEEGHSLPMHEISARLDVSRPHVTSIIDHLEGQGLVERVAHPKDRRSTIINLTHKGGERLKEVGPTRRDVLVDLFSPLDDAEKAQLLQMLRRLRAHILDQNEDEFCPPSERD